MEVCRQRQKKKSQQKEPPLFSRPRKLGILEASGSLHILLYIVKTSFSLRAEAGEVAPAEKTGAIFLSMCKAAGPFQCRMPCHFRCGSFACRVAGHQFRRFSVPPTLSAQSHLLIRCTFSELLDLWRRLLYNRCNTRSKLFT